MQLHQSDHGIIQDTFQFSRDIICNFLFFFFLYGSNPLRFDEYLVAATVMLVASCDSVSFKKTPSGLAYKIIPGSKASDSLLKAGQAIKFDYVRKFNDSIVADSYGKMPGYARVDNSPNTAYTIMEILTMMKVGDSAVVIEMADTLVKRGVMPPNEVKKGDRYITSFRILKVFDQDSLAQADYTLEMEKDAPRRLKEQQDRVESSRKKTFDELTKSGDVAKGDAEVQAYLKKNNITNARKAGMGTFVAVTEPGTGDEIVKGKWAKVIYKGRSLSTDSTFENGTYPLQVGVGGAIQGWDEGLVGLKAGSKATLYIPGYLAYGRDPGPGGKVFEALIFDVEIAEVSDKPIARE